jgi:hypothetical protein
MSHLSRPEAAPKLLRKKLSQSKSRMRRDTTTIFALESVASRLKEGDGTLAAEIFSYLAEVVNAKHQAVHLSGTASLERSDLVKAFARIGP